MPFLILPPILDSGSMDGWMICDYMSFSTVLQLYQDDGQLIMKGSVQWNPIEG